VAGIVHTYDQHLAQMPHVLLVPPWITPNVPSTAGRDARSLRLPGAGELLALDYPISPRGLNEEPTLPGTRTLARLISTGPGDIAWTDPPILEQDSDDRAVALCRSIEPRHGIVPAMRAALECAPGGCQEGSASMSERWHPTTPDVYDRLRGCTVYSSDNEKLGTIRAVLCTETPAAMVAASHYLRVDPGVIKRLFGDQEEVYIPEAMIQHVDTSRDTVVLEVTRDRVQYETWTRPVDLGACRRS
jgi:hypothetical protein